MTAVLPPTTWPDQGVAWHYGDPLGEQRRLAAGVGGVDLSNRAVLAVVGPDRRSWLHSLTTQHLEAMRDGESALALILSPHGHVEFELHLVDDGEAMWIITDVERAADLLAFLDRMRFMLQVEVIDRSPEFGVVWEPTTAVDPEHPTWIVPEPFAAQGFSGREVIVPSTDVLVRVESSGAPAGTWALEALRIAARMPRIGLDTDHRTIPNEVGWLGTTDAPNAVHLQKGCYRGQETVAKVHNLGRPPRRLALLLLDGTREEPPVHCDRVHWNGREVGWIGSGAVHYELGPIATAMLKRNVPEDAELVVELADGGRIAAAQSSD